MDAAFKRGEELIVSFLRDLSENPEAAELSADRLPQSFQRIGRELSNLHDAIAARTNELERSAFSDPLTGTGNRAGLDREMGRLWAQQAPFTCAYIDIDHLKHCNDNFGHAEGNRYILSVCAALTAALEEGESIYRVGGDEFILVSPVASEDDLETRLERCRLDLIDDTSHPGTQMIFSFSFGCSHAEPAAGDTRRQMTLDADRKMYRYKITHRVEQPTPLETTKQAPGARLDDQIFQALAMANEDRYLFVIDLDTRESQWSLSAVRDFNLPSEHPVDSLDLWVSLVHPDDRANVSAELANIVYGIWHFHTMQYRVMSASGKYALCEARGFRLDGENGSHSLYAGSIVNRSLAEVTDSVTGLGDAHALITAIGEACRNGNPTGFIAIKVDDIAKVNEKFGYEAGDRVLSETAGCIVDASRAKARVFRSHGVTFVAVFEGVSPEELEAARTEMHDSLISPVLLGACPYLPPVRISATYMGIVESQPTQIISDLGHKVKQAEQVPGTEL